VEKHCENQPFIHHLSFVMNHVLLKLTMHLTVNYDNQSAGQI
jgi:hypothetical protein